MMMLPCSFWPLAEHASFGQNCCDASIGSVSVCIYYSMPMDACFFNHSSPFHRIVGFYHHHLASLEIALARNNVPYRTLGGSSFFKRKTTRDMLAYLALVDGVRIHQEYLAARNGPT